MGNIKETVYLGKREEENQKLKILAEMAQPEVWTFKKIQDTDPYKILRNYIYFTYDRLDEEGKIITSKDGKYRCMNTGLLTAYNQEILGLFCKSNIPGKLPWYLIGFFKETDKRFTYNFTQNPPLANYFDNVNDLIYDYSLELKLRKEHIIEDNIFRFEKIGLTDKKIIDGQLDFAQGILEKKLRRNFKLALPFYYHNKETDERKIQLLVPLYLAQGPVRLALVINKVKSNAGEYYEGVTVLPVEWAYMNSRLITRPDEEWVKIIDESDEETDILK